MNKKALIEWYIENGVDDVIDETTMNHFTSHIENVDINGNVSCETSGPKKQLVNKSLTVSETHISSKTVNNIREEIKTKEVVKITPTETKREFDFNYIYQNLANKYKNDNMKLIGENKAGNVEDFIKKARELADNSNTIDELKDVVENFDGYLDIKKLATNTVFGEGNRNADIMIIGEAPGNNEDIEGRPFCGQSGQLLDAMFKSIGLSREELYISNTLFWRPPGNRTPTDDEIAICRPFVEKHIALINPKIIIFMGATALKDLIETNLTITKARRQLFDYTNQYLGEKIIKATPLFHPSYLLRQSSKKKEAWGDLMFVAEVLENIN